MSSKKVGRKPLAQTVRRIQVVVPESVYHRLQQSLVAGFQRDGKLLTMSALVRGMIDEWIEKQLSE